MSIKDNFPSVGPSLSLNFARSKTLDPRITFSRPSTSGDATYTDGNGLIVTAAADEPRFDHKYENGVVKSLGLLVEEQRTNLTTYSTDFSSGYSVANGSITTNQTTSPSGENNAALLTQTSTSTAYLWKGFSWTSGTKYTFSCYVKKYSASDENDVYILGYNTTFNSSGSSGDNSVVIFNLDDLTSTTAAGDVDGHSIIDAGNGWRRISATFTAYATETKSAQLLRFTDPNQTSYMYMWGYQIEEGAFPTSYIPTSGSTATRSPDNVSMTGTNFSDWYNQEQGTMVWVGNVYSKELSPVQPFRINRTNGGNLRGMGIQFDTRSVNNTVNFASRTQSSNIPSKVGPTGVIPSDDKIKIAGGYIESVGLSTLRGAFNGIPAASYSGSSQTDVVDGAMNELEIMGNRGISGSNIQFTGVCEQLVYYPKIFTDTQLQNLTK